MKTLFLKTTLSLDRVWAQVRINVQVESEAIFSAGPAETKDMTLPIDDDVEVFLLYGSGVCEKHFCQAQEDALVKQTHADYAFILLRS